MGQRQLVLNHECNSCVEKICPHSLIIHTLSLSSNLSIEIGQELFIGFIISENLAIIVAISI